MMVRLTLKELAHLMKAYKVHRMNAENRNIPFLFTFPEWLTTWRDSGHLHERGYRKGQYCMARFGDKGAYEVGNVRIRTVEENHKKCWDNPDTRTRMVEGLRRSNTDRKHTLETREKISESWKRRRIEHPTTPETREKMSESHKGKKKSPSHIENMSKAQQRRFKENPISPETKERIRQGQLRRRAQEY